MKQQSLIVIFTFTLSIFIGGCSVSTPVSQASGANLENNRYATLIQNMSANIIKGMKKHKVTGMSVALVDDGEIVWSQGFGYADKTNKRLVDGYTLFKAGSISKVFTATAIMQLVEQGKVDLDAPIQTYIPELKPKYHFRVDKTITLRLIMQHRSGLTGDKLAGMFNESPKRFETIIEYLHTVHHPYAPDTVTAYSNLATDLQGVVIERVTGMKYEDYMEQHIFNPLQMSTSTFDDSKVDQSLFSHAYFKHKQGIEYPLRDIPAGNLYTSATELSRFATMVLNQGQGVVRPSTLQQMLKPQQGSNEPHDIGPEFGLNWVIERPALKHLGQVAWHNGGTLHFMSEMVILPKQGLAAVVLSNTAGSIGFVEKTVDDILQEAAQIKNGIAKPGPRFYPGQPTATPEELLTTLPGHYATMMGGMEIKRKSGKLVGSVPGMSIQMQYLDNGWFQLKPHLFGFIPVPTKPDHIIRIHFKNKADTREIIADYHGMYLPAGISVPPYTIPDSWRSYLGSYLVELPTGDNPIMKTVKITEKDGYLFFEYKMNLLGGVRLTIRPISDDMAIIEGIGRGMQETIYMEKVGNEVYLRYNGYRSRKKL